MGKKSLRTLRTLNALTKMNKSKRRKPKKTIFEQFGVLFNDISGNQVISNCPFCGADDHFYINLDSENKAWDCKKCLRSGGFRGFVEQMVEYCFDESNEKVIEILEEERGNAITHDTLMTHIGYHPWTRKYVIPSADKDNSVVSIKLYDMKTMHNCTGFELGLYGLWEDEKIRKSDKIFLVEGEWDYLALIDILSSLRIDIPVLALPGAGSFKMHFTPYFENKDVYIVLDNDPAGTAGTLKVVQYLWDVAKTCYEIRWTDDKEKGFDIRDLLAKSNMTNKEAYEYIKDNLVESEEPEKIITGSKSKLDDEENEEVEMKRLIERFYPLQPVPHEPIFDIYKKHLYLPDDSILYIAFGAMIAGRISGNPLWLFIVGPSGCGKSEVLMSLSGAACVEAVSTLTPRSLVSGWNATGGGGDCSLLPKLHNKMLIIKDFTTILSMNRIDQEEIISILRDAYDGEFVKQFGNGILRKYKSKFGMVAATTAEIEMFSEQHSVMGERFIRWRMHIPDSLEKRLPYLEKAAENTGKERIIRIELKKAANQILEADYSKHIPSVPADLQKKLHSLALVTAKLRTMVPRDSFTKYIINTTETELATRLNKQFLKLMQGIGAMRLVKECSDFEYNLIKQVATSSIQYRVFQILKVICKTKTHGYQMKTIDKRSQLSTPVIELMIENMVSLKVIQELKNGSRIKEKYTYRLHPNLQKEIESSEIFN